MIPRFTLSWPMRMPSYIIAKQPCATLPQPRNRAQTLRPFCSIPGTALLTLGDESAAMQRFARALEAPDANRVDARLMFARVFVKQHKYETAQQQIALAFAESRVGEASPVDSDNYEAANLFLAMDDFDLARLLLRARATGRHCRRGCDHWACQYGHCRRANRRSPEPACKVGRPGRVHKQLRLQNGTSQHLPPGAPGVPGNTALRAPISSAAKMIRPSMPCSRWLESKACR